MSSPRHSLYSRLPAIYRIRDQEALSEGDRIGATETRPSGQLEAFVGILDTVMSGIHDNVEALYHDLFIETCGDWVVPYIADLLGTSHLAGDPRTVRADVARTVHHRRRKGTLGAVESLTYALTSWAAHTVELRERLLWNQHLNHQRPDLGGTPPLSASSSLLEPVRGGTVNLRDPAGLSFLDGPFGQFGHVCDVKPAAGYAVRFNLPNLAIFLWRLVAYTVPVTKPAFSGIVSGGGAAPFAVRFHVHPTGDATVLFNTHRFDADEDPPNLTDPDAVPGPMPRARLDPDAPSGNPNAYVTLSTYSSAPPAAGEQTGLTLHLPSTPFAATAWTIRGANLCAWEDGLSPPLASGEIAIDPDIGRIVIGVDSETSEAEPLRDGLLVTSTHGFSGPTGAQPIAVSETPATWDAVTPIVVDYHSDPDGLRQALDNLHASTVPIVIEIDDSMPHDLDLATVAGADNTEGAWTLRLAQPLLIRAADGQRPVIRLAQPLAFRPHDVGAANLDDLDVRLEGLYLTLAPGFAGDALIGRAALNLLQIQGCTLDPGGELVLDGTTTGTRGDTHTAAQLAADYGFSDANELEDFDQIPRIELLRSIAGPLFVDDAYELYLEESIVDGIDQYALRSCADPPADNWGPPTEVNRITIFGRTRVESIDGRGGIFVNRLEAHDNQTGCVRFSYFSGDSDRLPPHFGCVFGTDVDLGFTSTVFGRPGYAQLSLASGRHVLEQGPEADAMGAFGYLLNTHKWKNLNIRYREFMPVGIRPVLVTVT